MGEAKRRGTYEERVKMAIERDKNKDESKKEKAEEPILIVKEHSANHALITNLLLLASSFDIRIPKGLLK